MAVEQKTNVLVTGAGGGIGAAIGRSLVGAGHAVVLLDRDEQKVVALSHELGSRTFPLAIDITDGGGVGALPDRIPDAFQPIDILINNAGHDIGGRTRFDLGSADDWAAIIETNLIGLMRVTRAILPEMVRRNTGDIINMGSISALRIVPDMAPYNASKAGIHMLTDVIRAELADTGIRVTEIMPGLTRTGIILTRYRGDRTKEKEYFDQFTIALDPDDIARMILFALSQPRHVQIAEMVVLPVNRW